MCIVLCCLVLWFNGALYLYIYSFFFNHRKGSRGLNNYHYLLYVGLAITITTFISSTSPFFLIFSHLDWIEGIKRWNGGVWYLILNEIKNCVKEIMNEILLLVMLYYLITLTSFFYPYVGLYLTILCYPGPIFFPHLTYVCICILNIYYSLFHLSCLHDFVCLFFFFFLQGHTLPFLSIILSIVFNYYFYSDYYLQL